MDVWRHGGMGNFAKQNLVEWLKGLKVYNGKTAEEQKIGRLEDWQRQLTSLKLTAYSLTATTRSRIKCGMTKQKKQVSFSHLLFIFFCTSTLLYFHASDQSLVVIITSTLLFFALPSAVSFEAIGSVLPLPITEILFFTP